MRPWHEARARFPHKSFALICFHPATVPPQYKSCLLYTSLRLDVSFLGTSGVQGRGGICSTGFHDIPVKQEFIHRSRRTVVLADSSKFASASLVEVADWTQVDTLITDSGIDPEQARQLAEKVELVIADES